ncbi:hypothetical protein KIL84_022339 [Mauremys mutica]|uniref:Uncharacterized protein n=1 Tax=Mauremys mutica TaxID=74926 RepID=A0A9D4AZV9_9SAUR|nr:hypothetical protein KIL84_022339 [Mauremys mutica]
MTTVTSVRFPDIDPKHQYKAGLDGLSLNEQPPVPLHCASSWANSWFTNVWKSSVNGFHYCQWRTKPALFLSLIRRCCYRDRLAFFKLSSENALLGISPPCSALPLLLIC